MAAEIHAKNTFRAWASLIRLPNLLTVPGDVLVGFALAMPGQAIPADLLAAMLAGVFFYGAGLLINDLVDAERDRAERPHRPIPSGAISRLAAINAATVMLGLALLMLALRGLAPLLAGVVLGCLIFIYNLYARNRRWTGALVMGACRAGNVSLGIVAGAPSAWVGGPAAAVLTWWVMYVGVISWLAAREVDGKAYGRERWLPMFILLVGGVAIMLYVDQTDPQSLFRATFGICFAALIAYQSAMRLGVIPRAVSRIGKIKDPPASVVFPPVMGALISVLIPMQAALLVLLSDEPWMLLAALLLLFCWPINRWLARRFAAS